MTRVSSPAAARDVLRLTFGYDAFRGTQEQVIGHVIDGGDALVLMPTGGGKSLCFQLPALARYYRNGSLTVVISPLQSLMKDQVDNLEARGIKTVYVTGLATDFCVGWTALDARAAGFEVFVIEDACRAIDLDGSLAAAWTQMTAAGVKRIQSDDIGRPDPVLVA